MIRRLDPTSAAFKLLETNDVLLSFDGVLIANDGTVPFRSGERIGFRYGTQMCAAEQVEAA